MEMSPLTPALGHGLGPSSGLSLSSLDPHPLQFSASGFFRQSTLHTAPVLTLPSLTGLLWLPRSPGRHPESCRLMSKALRALVPTVLCSVRSYRTPQTRFLPSP